MPLNSRGNVNLIIVDVQQGFNEERFWGKRNNPEAEANIARLIAAWRTSGKASKIRHVCHASKNPDSPLHPSSPGFAFKKEAQPLAGEHVYRKEVNSSFIGTSLEADLRADGVTELIICGLTTPHCVSTTTRMAGNLGFTVFLLEDATAAHERRALDGRMRPAEEVHLGALSDIDDEFCEVVKTADVLSALGRS